MLRRRVTAERLLRWYGPVIERLSSVVVERPADRPPRCLLVASSSPRDGRTTTALGLALTAAMLKPGKRVLLAGTDLRQGGLPSKLGLNELAGVREILAGEANFDSVLQPTRQANLSLLPAGRAAIDLPEALREGPLASLIGAAVEQFDLVLLDSPPAGQFADARLLAERADAVVLVIRAGHTRADDIQAARRQFDSKLAGALLSDFRHPVPRILRRYL